MFNHVLVAFHALFSTAALQNEVDAVEADFRSGLLLTFVDTNGTKFPISLDSPSNISAFAQVKISEPPRRIGNSGGPFPIAYLYHLHTEYPVKEQEDNIVVGVHKWGISIYASGNTADESEQSCGRLSIACKRLIERNQYVFGAIPRVHGAASLTEVTQIVPNQRGAQTVMGYHIICTTNIKEFRTLT